MSKEVSRTRKSPRKPSKKSSASSSRAANGTGDAVSQGMYKALTRFRDVHISEKPNLLREKLSMCCVVFDFSDPSKNPNEKEIKGQTLVQLKNYVASVTVTFDVFGMKELMKMVATNLFRKLPSRNHENDEPSLEPAWPHLRLVYDILRSFIFRMTDTNLAKKYIDEPFVLKLLALFDSEDHREREKLKIVLLGVYEKFLDHRLCIIKGVKKICTIVHKTEKLNCIGELLEILESIIIELLLPLNEEHKLFLAEALISLHKPNCVSVYHPKLSNSIVQLVKKDFKRTDTVVKGLLEYWPVSDSSTEVMFLGELEEVLKATQAAEFKLCLDPLFKQIARCLNSSNDQVAEKAVFLWSDDHIRNLIAQNQEVVLSIVSKALDSNPGGHWKQAVKHLSANAKIIFGNVAGVAAISVDKSVEFTEEELSTATDYFNETKKIGHGGFGDVYSAVLRGENAAIKKMNMDGLKQFLAELNVLTRVHHVNLVRLIGYCVAESLFLVYELVENGNLQHHLDGSGRDPLPPLPWTTREQIALNSAKGLEYIHHCTVPGYVHRDIKSANILIDKSFRAKIADFGLATVAEVGGSSTRDEFGTVSYVAPTVGEFGTFGYMPPESLTGEVSVQGDVFSFGVVLYQLISAKDALGLVSVFEKLFAQIDKKKALRELIDPRLGKNYPFDSVYKMAKLAKACTQMDAQLRPSMSDIVVALSPRNWDVQNPAAAVSHGNSASGPLPLEPAVAVSHGDSAPNPHPLSNSIQKRNFQKSRRTRK